MSGGGRSLGFGAGAVVAESPELESDSEESDAGFFFSFFFFFLFFFFIFFSDFSFFGFADSAVPFGAEIFAKSAAVVSATDIRFLGFAGSAAGPPSGGGTVSFSLVPPASSPRSFTAEAEDIVAGGGGNDVGGNVVGGNAGGGNAGNDVGGKLCLAAS